MAGGGSGGSVPGGELPSLTAVRGGVRGAARGTGTIKWSRMAIGDALTAGGGVLAWVVNRRRTSRRGEGGAGGGGEKVLRRTELGEEGQNWRFSVLGPFSAPTSRSL